MWVPVFWPGTQIPAVKYDPDRHLVWVQDRKQKLIVDLDAVKREAEADVEKSQRERALLQSEQR